MRAPLLPRRSSRKSGAGFTLIELLVVISIIAVLAGLLLPVIRSVTENARKADAKSTELQIVAAVKNYQTEYGVYPVAAQTTPIDATFDKSSASNASGKYGHNNILFAVLRATNTPANDGLNTRAIVYFESKDVKNTASARDGFIPANPSPAPQSNKGDVTLVTGDLTDPWGNLYYIRIDSNYTDIVMNPYSAGTTDSATGGGSISYGSGYSDQTTVTDQTTIIHTDVIAWSPGYDGAMGTAGSVAKGVGDDVLSWQ